MFVILVAGSGPSGDEIKLRTTEIKLFLLIFFCCEALTINLGIGVNLLVCEVL